jgi:hypothetical protein
LGIVHRDVKPANLMLTRAGRCKVADFGLARLDEVSDASSGLRESCGTPQFIAPEVLRGAPASAASDVYSLGSTLWFLLTGKPPYTARRLGELLRKVLEEPLPDLAALRPDLPAPLVRAAQTALAKRPADRFASAEQFSKVLRVHAIPVESGATTLTQTSPQEVLATAHHRPAVLVGAACVAALLLAAVLIPLLGRATPRTSDASVTLPPNRSGAEVAIKAATDPPPAAAPLATAPRPRPFQPLTVGRHTDLLARLDLASAVVKGDWHFDGGDLVSDSSGPAILELPQTVPDEYDFVIEFTPQDCAQQLLCKPHASPAGGVAFNWCMNVGDLSGFESINGRHLFEPGAPAARHFVAEPGTRHTSCVRVRKDAVQGWVDGEMIVEWKTDYHDLGRLHDWPTRDNDKLGLGSWNKPTRFHKAELIDPAVTPGPRR